MSEPGDLSSVPTFCTRNAVVWFRSNQCVQRVTQPIVPPWSSHRKKGASYCIGQTLVPKDDSYHQRILSDSLTWKWMAWHHLFAKETGLPRPLDPFGLHIHVTCSSERTGCLPSARFADCARFATASRRRRAALQQDRRNPSRQSPWKGRAHGASVSEEWSLSSSLWSEDWSFLVLHCRDDTVCETAGTHLHCLSAQCSQDLHWSSWTRQVTAACKCSWQLYITNSIMHKWSQHGISHWHLHILQAWL